MNHGKPRTISKIIQRKFTPFKGIPNRCAFKIIAENAINGGYFMAGEDKLRILDIEFYYYDEKTDSPNWKKDFSKYRRGKDYPYISRVGTFLPHQSGVDITFENSKHKLGVRIWGNIDSFHTLHELLGGCWDCESEEMTNKENSSHIGVISYFSYEVRHAFMGHRRVRMDDKVVVQWTDELSEAFEKEEGRVEVGMEFSWPHMLFIMAAWWECLKH